MQPIKINKIEITNEATEMYDLEVEDNHNFILGNGILSHNSGKSCLGYHLLELHNQRQCYVYKSPLPSALPSFIQNITNLDEAQKDGVILIDEAALEFSQFSFNKKTTLLLSEMIKTARHNNLSLIFITQNAATLTRDVIRLVDTLLLREPSLMQKYDERGIIKQLYKNCEEKFKTKTGKLKGYYLIDSDLEAFITFNLPSFWSEQLSKSYAEEETYNSSSILKSFISGVREGLSERRRR